MGNTFQFLIPIPTFVLKQVENQLRNTTFHNLIKETKEQKVSLGLNCHNRIIDPSLIKIIPIFLSLLPPTVKTRRPLRRLSPHLPLCYLLLHHGLHPQYKGADIPWHLHILEERKRTSVKHMETRWGSPVDIRPSAD